MERSVMFLQSLLMLVVAIQVISACDCTAWRMEEAICRNFTIVMATPLSKKDVDENGTTVCGGSLATQTKYKMYLNILYQPGWRVMKESDIFDMYTPLETDDCGIVLEIGEEYYISGGVGLDGLFYTDSCEFVKRVCWHDDPFEHSRAKNDLLTHQRELDCEKISLTGRALV